MVEAARIAWAAILIKTHQLILFDGAAFGILSLARSGANGPEWTHEGPQNGPQILREFWGSSCIPFIYGANCTRFKYYYSRFMLLSENCHLGEYSRCCPSRLLTNRTYIRYASSSLIKESGAATISRLESFAAVYEIGGNAGRESFVCESC